MTAFADVRAVLLDLDGVLYVEDDAIAGAVDAVRRLRDDGLAVRMVTNTTSKPRRAIVERLDRLGFRPDPATVVTPSALAVRHCRAHRTRRVMLLMKDAVKEDFAALEETDDDVEAVIVGDLGEGFTPAVLNRAFRAVLDGAELIALQKNRFWRTPDGLSLDVGPFVAALEYGTGREALVVGKPARAFFASVLDELGIDPAAAVMVGDDIESDVGGALRAGLAGVLVRTGKYREDAVRASGIEPTAVVDSIADVPVLLSPSSGR